ncbi:response regulator transcription factor [Neptunicoccus sediminis]|uniref:response regulator transcription factor n=1 Tax=Neptunicoccus sediminis TaxID=1892596 RepID=UPI000845D531|nr:response regulator [Neptunicoccus sediminis]
MKILIVDDDPEIIEILEAFLAHAGYQNVVSAGSGAQALALLDAAAVPFDCFILDIQMPVMSGTELLRKLREMPDYQNAPVLKLTAMGDARNIQGAFAAGALDYITKPFEFFEVETRLHAAETRLASLRNLRNDPAAGLPEMERALVAAVEKAGRANTGSSSLIPKDAFENFLFQLKQNHPERLNILALKVKNLPSLHMRLSAEGFRYYLSQMIRVLAKTVEQEGFLFTYHGDGAFLVQNTSSTPAQVALLCDRFSKAMARMDEAFISVDYVKSRIAFGHSSHECPPEAFQPVQMLETALSQAQAA